MAIGSPHPGHRWCAPDVDQRRGEVVDQAGRRGRAAGRCRRPAVRRRSITRAHHHPSRSASPQDVATSRSGAMPKPELSRLSPPMNSHRRPPEHGQADVVDHLALVVLVDGDGPGAAGRASATAAVGNGNERDRPHEADPRALGPQRAHRGADVARRACRTRPRRHRRRRCRADLGHAARRRRASSSVRRRAGRVVGREVVADVVALLGRAEDETQLGLAGAAASSRRAPSRRPGGGPRSAGHVDRLRGVGEVVVAEHQHRVAPPVGQVERAAGRARPPRPTSTGASTRWR